MTKEKPLPDEDPAALKREIAQDRAEIERLKQRLATETKLEDRAFTALEIRRTILVCMGKEYKLHALMAPRLPANARVKEDIEAMDRELQRSKAEIQSKLARIRMGKTNRQELIDFAHIVKNWIGSKHKLREKQGKYFNPKYKRPR